MFTTRLDRMLTILAFVVCLLAVLALARVFFSLLGAAELLVALALAIPITVFLSRLLRSIFSRGDHAV